MKKQYLTKDSYIITNRGKISIKEAKIGDKIQTIKNGKIYWTVILDFFPQIKKKVIKLTTNNGDELVLTKEHKILTFNGWKEASDLKIGECVASVQNNSLITKKIELHEEQEIYGITTKSNDFLANNILIQD